MFLFERLAARGHAELRDDPGRAAATLREALALWRGPALADVAEAEFAQAVIARLDERARARPQRPARGVDQLIHTASAAGLSAAFVLAGLLGIAGGIVAILTMRHPTAAVPQSAPRPPVAGAQQDGYRSPVRRTS